jgi:HK97 family phage portal protein
VNFFRGLLNKLNPAQEDIVGDYGTHHGPSNKHYSNSKAYKDMQVVNRGVNLIIDSASQIKLDIGDSLPTFVAGTRLRVKKLDILLNFTPNQFLTNEEFLRNIYLDLIVEGDAFIYYDGASLFNLPALNVEVMADDKAFIKGYRYGTTDFKPNEVIHIRESSAESIFTGTSRLDSCKDNISTLSAMLEYQKNFFKNSAIPGLIITTPNPLSPRKKERLLESWRQKFNPKSGGRSPMLLDGDFKVENMNKYNFNELDFVQSSKEQEAAILKALGVPPILLDSGNNANISPNLRMFYINTVLPLVTKVTQSFERYFGYDLKPVTQDVLALQPELRELANFHSTLVNAGIITRNESRAKLRYPYSDSEIADELVLPANVAGSAASANLGGKPIEEQE